MPIAPGSIQRKAVVKSVVYDFDVDAGAVGTIQLTDKDGLQALLPEDGTITSAYLEAVTAPTSGGAATIALGVDGDAEAFLAAAAFDGGKFDVGARSLEAATMPVAVAASGEQVLMTIAGADLTAGRLALHVEYLPSIDDVEGAPS